MEENKMNENLTFAPDTFMEVQTAAIKRIVGTKKTFLACSGGVDSTVCAVLTHKALHNEFLCIFIDTGFMRLNEPKNVVESLSSPPLNLPIRLVDEKETFYRALEGLSDAEEKRKAFRNAFYSVLSRVSREDGYDFLVQGTIRADIIETEAGVKTQHNVLQQIKINPKTVYGFQVIEPLADLYKNQVRVLARYLGIPSSISERQPFPGPGLSVRVIGRITREKLAIEKKATEIIEKELKVIGSRQYFSAIFENEKIYYPRKQEVIETIEKVLGRKPLHIDVHTLKSRATGIKKGIRAYGRIILLEIEGEKESCMELSKETYDKIQEKILKIDIGATRVLYKLSNEKKRDQIVLAIRAIETQDFMTAQISDVPWQILGNVADSVMECCPEVASIYYDITPKPPATIEFE